MKKLILLALTAFTLNAHAQLNLDWSETHSLSGGDYKSIPVLEAFKSTISLTSASNDFFEATEDSTKGVVARYDSTGTLQWSTVLTPAVSVSDFPDGGYGIVRIEATEEAGGIVVAYNINPTTSRLIRIDSTGAIVWNVVVAGINNISGRDTDASGRPFTVLVGRMPQGNCGGFPCNGIAIAKYDSTGTRLWKKTKYTTNFRTRPMDIMLDDSGNVVVCGKKAAILNSPNYEKTFITKYSNAGTALWTKEFSDTTTESLPQSVVPFSVADYIWSYTVTVQATAGLSVKTKKLAASNGAVQWTKTINNSELIWSTSVGGSTIVATTTGMKAYNSAGTLLWSNNYVVRTGLTANGGLLGTGVIATNVSPTEPLSNFLVQLDADSGTVLLQKNLSLGNHEEYMGEYIGLNLGGSSQTVNILINDTTAPYGTRVTKLSECSDFTYSYSASTVITSISGTNCNNGKIKVNLSGTFNSWSHIELWQGITKVGEADHLNASNVTFENLSAGAYTVKVYDESCGEQVFNVTVKCPKPSSGFSTTNQTNNSAQVNWNHASCNNGYRVQYRLQGTSAWTTVSTATNNKVLTGLNSLATYEWRVATQCINSTPVTYSSYTNNMLFTTQSPLQENTNQRQPAYYSNDFEITIAPNPVSDKLMITPETDIPAAVIKVFNAQGQLVLEKNISALNENEPVEVETGSLSKGIYLLQMISEEGMVTKRFVKH